MGRGPWQTWLLLLALLLGTIEGPAYARAPKARPALRAGSWEVTGPIPDWPKDDPRGGILELKGGPVAFELLWKTRDDLVTAGGKGIFLNGRLYVTWIMGAEYSNEILLFKIERNGTLTRYDVPRWDGKLEVVGRAVGGKPGRLAGAYRDPDRKFGGQIRISRRGRTYDIKWSASGTIGTGLRVGNWFIASWAFSYHRNNGVAVYRFKGGRGKGRWIRYRQPRERRNRLRHRSSTK